MNSGTCESPPRWTVSRMNLVLRRLNTAVEGDQSVEAYIKDLVSGMDAEKRLDTTIEGSRVGFSPRPCTETRWHHSCLC